jgi:hypothetical protein
MMHSPFCSINVTCYCLSYTNHTYNSLNKQLSGTVIVLVIPTTLTHSLNKQPKGTVIFLVIPTPLTIV